MTGITKFIKLCELIESYCYLLDKYRISDILHDYNPASLLDFKYKVIISLLARQFITYMQDEKYKFKKSHIKSAFDKLLRKTFKRATIGITQTTEDNLYLISRVKNYFKFDMDEHIIWLTVCASFKIDMLRKEEPEWIPESLYGCTLSELNLLPDDHKLFRESLGKNYKNTVRIIFTSLGDLFHDISTDSNLNEVKLNIAYKFIKRQLKMCGNIEEYYKFLNQSYSQLFIVSCI